MSDQKRAKVNGGLEPLTEGYQPRQKGYQPKSSAESADAAKTPPSGGSSAMLPSAQQPPKK